MTLLTLLNGVFAMSEMAVASSKKARLAAMAESGDHGAQVALQLMEQPTQFLSTVQVGITSIGMLNGIVGESAFSEPVAQWLMGWGVGERPAGVAATATVVAVITFFTIIFGELVPKRIAQLFPEATARWIARPMRGLSKLAGPFVRLLSGTTAAVLSLLRINTSQARAVTEEEISASLEEGVDAGLIEEHEHQMVRNVFHLDDRNLASMMVPRADIVWLAADVTVAGALQQLAGQAEVGAHSWYPVCRGGLDEVVGVVSVAQLLALGASNTDALATHALSASYVPETLTGMELLEQLRAKEGRMVFVVDEYGVVQGLVTPRDLLEAITGELHAGETADLWAHREADGSWTLSGQMPVSELKARLDIEDLPDEDRGRYNTLGGLIMALLGHVPTVGDSVECADWHFDVTAMQGRRIEGVVARRVGKSRT